jgi:hypothetical protein
VVTEAGASSQRSSDCLGASDVGWLFGTISATGSSARADRETFKALFENWGTLILLGEYPAIGMGPAASHAQGPTKRVHHALLVR